MRPKFTYYIRSTYLIFALTLATFPFQNCGRVGFQLPVTQTTDQGSTGADDNSDVLAPNVAILTPLQGAFVKSTLNISGACEAGLPVQLSINAGTPLSIVCNGGTFSSSINLTQADGAIDLVVEQIDAGGNKGTKQVTITKDTVAPVMQFTAPAANAQVTTQALTVTGSCETGLNVMISGNALSAPSQVACVNSAFTAALSTVNVNGTYSLNLAQTDAAGNQGSATRNIAVNIAAGTPVIRIAAPAANSATRTGITISGTCVTGLPVQISGAGVSQASQTTCANAAFSAAINFSNGDGTKNIIVAQTNAQNQTGQDSRAFTLDTTAPAVVILNPAAGTQSDAALTIGGSCETGLSVAISGTGAAAAASVPCTAATFQIIVNLSANAGVKTITASQTDAVGNVGSNSRNFERIAPILDGKVLYANNCASCHGVLASSTKLNRTALQITNAIATIPNMGAIKLSVEQVSAVAQALASAPVITPMACADTTKILAPQMKRLTIPQFANSVRNAFGNIFQDSQFPNMNDANPRIGLGSDPDHLKIDEVNINALYDSVNSLVTTISAQNATVSACVAGTSTTCHESVMTTMGLKLWRRPLTTANIATFNTGLTAITNAGGSRKNRMDFILKGLIMAPEHMYRSEIGSSTTPQTAVFSLTQYEIASLLAFTVWDSPPDDTLLEAARTNALGTKAAIKSQLTRMASNPLFAKKMASFAVDVLKIEDIKTIVKDAAFGMTAADRTALYTSARTTLESNYASTTSDLMAPFSAQQFHTNNLTARYFGVGTTGLTANFTAFNADPAQRFGMLSHPAFLTSMSGQVSSGIVRRGVYTLEQLLCNHIGAPPADVMGVKNLPADWDPTKVTSRQELIVTHSSQAVCSSCHSKIDPAGFGFENYNNFGQFRLFEKGNIPIDASGNLVGASVDTLSFNDSVGYLKALANSPTLRQCMQKRYFKYASGESHETTAGQCEFNNFEYQISQKGNSIQALVESYIELQSFSTRKPASP
ncbi:DUF1588 domain-containing protein [Bdellovibrio sp. HCB337]|uniref:DUF1588 domain-containing protein n=1 Tax=Bdellovibrio sp. HCB337 TaxID=3394358 RepID=UPI0039A7165F